MMHSETLYTTKLNNSLLRVKKKNLIVAFTLYLTENNNAFLITTKSFK